MRECLSSKKFLQAIFDHGENSRVKIISSYIHNPPVKHLQKFLDVLDKLGFNEKEAQMLRFLLQTLILSGHRGKFGLAPEPLIAGNLAKGPDDVGTTGLRPPSDFGVMSCPLELAPKQSKEKTREIPNPPHLAAHSSTVHATNALPPHTYAAQQANTQFVYGNPPYGYSSWQTTPPYAQPPSPAAQLYGQTSPAHSFSPMYSPPYFPPETYAHTSLDSPTILTQALPSTSSSSSNIPLRSFTPTSPVSSQYTSPASTPAGSRPASSPASPSLSRSNSGSNVHAAVFIPSAFKKPPAASTGKQKATAQASEPDLRFSTQAHAQGPSSAASSSSPHGSSNRFKPPISTIESRTPSDMSPRNDKPLIPREPEGTGDHTARDFQGGSHRNPRESEASQRRPINTPTTQDRDPRNSQQASREPDSTQSLHRRPESLTSQEHGPRNPQTTRQHHKPKSRETPRR